MGEGAGRLVRVILQVLDCENRLRRRQMRSLRRKCEERRERREKESREKERKSGEAVPQHGRQAQGPAEAL